MEFFSGLPPDFAKMGKIAKVCTDRYIREFLFPRHLPVDIGSHCTDFLSIQEQCRIRRTSTQIGKFVQRALERAHEKGVVIFSVTKQATDSCCCRSCVLMPRAGPGYLFETWNIVHVSTACPRIERFYYLRNDKWNFKAKPMKFYMGTQVCAWDRPVLSLLDLRGIASSPHITCLDVCINDLFPVDEFESVLKQLPHLCTLNLSVKLFSKPHVHATALHRITYNRQESV